MTNANGEEIRGAISYYFAPRWFSAGGTELTLVLTGSDHWSTVRSKLDLATREMETWLHDSS